MAIREFRILLWGIIFGFIFGFIIALIVSVAHAEPIPHGGRHLKAFGHGELIAPPDSTIEPAVDTIFVGGIIRSGEVITEIKPERHSWWRWLKFKIRRLKEALEGHDEKP